MNWRSGSSSVWWISDAVTLSRLVRKVSIVGSPLTVDGYRSGEQTSSYRYNARSTRHVKREITIWQLTCGRATKRKRN